jgi:hypothetical protein
MKDKFLFLDFDGVLHSNEKGLFAHLPAVEVLSEKLKKDGIKLNIVFSTSWQDFISFHGLENEVHRYATKLHCYGGTQFDRDNEQASYQVLERFDKLKPNDVNFSNRFEAIVHFCHKNNIDLKDIAVLDDAINLFYEITSIYKWLLLGFSKEDIIGLYQLDKDEYIKQVVEMFETSTSPSADKLSYQDWFYDEFYKAELNERLSRESFNKIKQYSIDKLSSVIDMLPIFVNHFVLVRDAKKGIGDDELIRLENILRQ